MVTRAVQNSVGGFGSVSTVYAQLGRLAVASDSYQRFHPSQVTFQDERGALPRILELCKRRHLWPLRPLPESATRAASLTRSDVHALWHALRPGVQLLASDSLSVFACREPVEHELPLSEPQA